MGEKDRGGGVTDITWGRRIGMGELQTLHGGEGWGWGSYRHYMGEKDRDGGVTDITWWIRVRVGDLQAA